MVTLYYLRRYLTFCRELFRSHDGRRASALSAEVAEFLDAIEADSRTASPAAGGRPLSDRAAPARARRSGPRRERVSPAHLRDRDFPIAKPKSPRQQLLEFIRRRHWIGRIIPSDANRRPDGLYHAYNLVRLDSKAGLPIRRLYEMLEGQVAVLSSGHLSAEESLKLLAALKRSAMYRADQHSYLLYPNRQLPRFVERNNIPAREVRRSALLRKLLADGNRQLVERDIAGRVHFNASVTNARDIRRILDELAGSGYASLVKRDGPAVLDLFERLFDHESFTGRSGTFFGYEGLGCIYWHMVSKLLLAAQETYFRAVEAGAPKRRAAKAWPIAITTSAPGLAITRRPEVYGAFPMDPYSHTPAQGGARQPGLTGQVKEDFLCRMGELGVLVKNGEILSVPAFCDRRNS